MQEPKKLSSIALRVAVLIAGTCAISMAYGQAKSSAETSPEQAETIVLSPFEVDATADVGYVAERDLSGTRLNTSLRDTAASVTVLTKEFLDDIGAINVTDALDYMPNVTYDTLNNDATDINYVRPRIRGLSALDAVMVDFFPEYTDLDRYKLERIGVSRGPNAILAGVGDPAGTLTASTKKAGLRKNTAELETMFTTTGSARFSLDSNRVLIKDRLAFRVVGLQQNIKPEIQPAYRKDKRLFVATTANIVDLPSFRTTFDANYEWVDGHDVNGNGNLPLENVSTWVAAGSPTKDNSTGGILPGTVNNGKLLLDIPGLPVMNWAGTMSTTGTSNPVLQEVLFPYDVNIKGDDGVAPRKVNQGSFTLRQQIGQDLFLEAAYFHAEEQNIWPIKVVGARISADPNLLLPNGQPNPNAGKFFVEHDGRTDTRLGKRDVGRLQAVYSFNFDKISPTMGKWFGRHSVFGLYENKREWVATERLQTVNTTPLPGFSSNLSAAENRVYHRSYLDFENGIYSFSAYDYRTALDKDGLHIEALPVLAQTTAMTKNESETFALQSYFWDDRIVTMFGFRSDESETYAGSPVRDSRGVFPLARTVPTELTVANKFNPTSKGIVFHALPWISLSYNESENFKAGAAASRDFFGNNLPTEGGSGKDYGVRLNLLDDRLSVSLTKYESGRVNAVETAGTVGINEINRIWEALGSPEKVLTPFPTTRDTFDNVAKGYELSLTFNPNRSWRFYVTGAKNETVLSNYHPGFQQYFAQNSPTWLKSSDLVTSGGNTIAQEVADLETISEINLSQEGVQEFNSREWSGSAAVAYSFTEGLLKGLKFTANFRYLGDAIVGTPVINKIARPDLAYNEDGYSIVGLGLSYSKRFRGRFDFYTSLKVDNALDYDGRVTILARSPSDGSPLKARWTPGTSASLTTGVRF